MIYETNTWVLIALGLLLAGAAVAMARARAALAQAMIIAVVSMLAALALFALDAPDLALLEAIVGVGVIAPLFLGTVTLTAKTAAATPVRWMAPAGAVLIAVLLCWAIPDLPALGEKGADTTAAIYVNRAVGESGLPNAVTAISANYRAIDSLLAAGALFLAALGAYAVLGFGERSALRRPVIDAGDAP